MKNNKLIMITEENATPELVEMAFNSKMGLHYETDSKLVRSLIKNHADKILKEKRGY